MPFQVTLSKVELKNDKQIMTAYSTREENKFYGRMECDHSKCRFWPR